MWVVVRKTETLRQPSEAVFGACRQGNFGHRHRVVHAVRVYAVRSQERRIEANVVADNRDA